LAKPAAAASELREAAGGGRWIAGNGKSVLGPHEPCFVNQGGST
jgi:hypothetical protein